MLDMGVSTLEYLWHSGAQRAGDRTGPPGGRWSSPGAMVCAPLLTPPLTPAPSVPALTPAAPQGPGKSPGCLRGQSTLLPEMISASVTVSYFISHEGNFFMEH